MIFIQICALVFLVWTFGVITLCLFKLAKINNADHQRRIIMKAIADYQISCKKSGWLYMVVFDDMEPFNSTVNRLRDWGYTRILPEMKYNIIKPFIK